MLWDPGLRSAVGETSTDYIQAKTTTTNPQKPNNKTPNKQKTWSQKQLRNPISRILQWTHYSPSHPDIDAEVQILWNMGPDCLLTGVYAILCGFLMHLSFRITEVL